MRFLALSSLVLVGCTSGLTPRPSTRADPAELVAAERAFMEATHARGVEGWVSFFADSGAQIPDRGPPVVGHAAIRRHMANAFTDPRAQLRWTPLRADVASSGDLGYTYGTWQLVARDSSGNERTAARGKYITVWQRDASGRWKVAVDGGNQEPMGAR